jgi:hypothetical protein
MGVVEFKILVVAVVKVATVCVARSFVVIMALCTRFVDAEIVAASLVLLGAATVSNVALVPPI